MLVVFDCSSESVICKYSFVLRRSGSFEEKNFSDDSSDWHSESASDRISEYEGLSNRRAHSSFSEHLDKVSHEIRLIIKLLYSLSKVNPYKSVSKQFND